MLCCHQSQKCPQEIIVSKFTKITDQYSSYNIQKNAFICVFCAFVSHNYHRVKKQIQQYYYRAI